jgi:colicin import membrane protein
MAGEMPSPTISLRERSFPLVGAEERLPRWLVFSFLLHVALIACFFLVPMLPAPTGPVHPVYVVDLIGGEKIGATNLGTELTRTPKQSSKTPETEKAPVIPETKKEVKKEPPEKVKPVEKKAPQEEKIALKEKTKTEPIKKEPVKETKEETKTESASADSVRERLLQSAVERAKARGESAQKTAKGEVLSSGSGEGEGAAAIGAGGRGGPGIVKGMDFIIYQNRMLSTIKENWAWVGQRSNLRVVVHFGIKENGEIVGLKIVQPSGDPSYDESVLRAVKKSSPLAAPPESYRKDFADVELTFRPRDLGA